MRLGRKLFLLLGGLLCLLSLGQWLLYRSLAETVSDNVRTVAFRVGEDIVSGFEYKVEGVPGEAGATSAPAPEAMVLPRGPIPPGGSAGHARVIVLRTDHESGLPHPTATADGPAPDEGSAAPEEGVRVLRREWRWKSGEPPHETTTEFERRISPDEPFRMAVGVDENSDALLLRGPEVERSIPIPGRIVASSLERFRSQMLAGNLALLAVGLLVAAFVAHRMTRPLAALAAAAERIGAGELGAEVSVPQVSGGDEAGGDEVTRAVASFNRMSHRLSELDRENRRLTEAERLSELGEVARGLAHSLRNPLNALGLSIERLGARAASDDEARQSAEALVEGSRRQIRRIDGALRSFLALASAGAVEGEEVDVAALSREVALEALQDASAAPAPPRIEVECVDAGPHRVVGVAAELKAILQALTINACEAARHEESGGGAEVVIRVSRSAEGTVAVQVEDNGQGVPESVRARLFTPHVTTKPHGSGMGLFLAHRLTTARYGGTLRLEPREGGGTRAVLEIGDRVAERAARAATSASGAAAS